jgi:transcriptional regulator with XRE-family HTH domain
VPEIGQVRKNLGANIRSLREKAGLTRKKLAEKADLHPVYLGQVENGHKAISVAALWEISKALHIPISGSSIFSVGDTA